MKFVFLTNIISPHQMPLARELVNLLGADEYRYVYTEREEKERTKLGWGNKGEDWCLQGDENTAVFSDLQKLEGVGLVVPVGEEHMYYAAMNSKACELTAVGKQYWRLVKEGRI